MPFPAKFLNPGEEVALDLRPHWWFFARQMSAAIAALALLVITVVIDDTPSVIEFAALALFVAALVWLGLRLIAWQGVNMVVTNERLIFRTGVVSKKGIEIPLDRINTVFFNQSVFERLIGSGDLSVESAGEGGRQDFHDVWRPNRVQQLIYQAKEAAEDREHKEAAEAIVQAQIEAAERLGYTAPVDPVAPAPVDPTGFGSDGSSGSTLSIPEQISQLDDLRVRGIITDAEFQTKKTELLNRM